MKTLKWTMSSTSSERLEAAVTTVRQYPPKSCDEDSVVGAPVALSLRCDLRGSEETTDRGRYTVYAALWRDAFDERTGRALYVLLRDADDMPSGVGRQAAVDEAEEIVRRFLDDGAHDAGEPFEPVEGEAEAVEGEAVEGECRALVPAKGRKLAVAEPETESIRGSRVDDGPFELKSGPSAREMRSAVLDEIEGAEKAAGAARSRMKKLALAVADLRAAGLSDESAILDFKSAQAEWMQETDALASAQERLRSLDAEIAAGRIA